MTSSLCRLEAQWLHRWKNPVGVYWTEAKGVRVEIGCSKHMCDDVLHSDYPRICFYPVLIPKRKMNAL